MTPKDYPELCNAYDVWCVSNNILEPPNLWVVEGYNRLTSSACAVLSSNDIILADLGFADSSVYTVMEQLGVIAHEVLHKFKCDINPKNANSSLEEREADQFAVETTSSHFIASAVEKFDSRRAQRLENDCTSRDKSTRKGARTERGKLKHDRVHETAAKRIMRI